MYIHIHCIHAYTIYTIHIFKIFPLLNINNIGNVKYCMNFTRLLKANNLIYSRTFGPEALSVSDSDLEDHLGPTCQVQLTMAGVHCSLSMLQASTHEW